MTRFLPSTFRGSVCPRVARSVQQATEHGALLLLPKHERLLPAVQKAREGVEFTLICL